MDFRRAGAIQINFVRAGLPTDKVNLSGSSYGHTVGHYEILLVQASISIEMSHRDSFASWTGGRHNLPADSEGVVAIESCVAAAIVVVRLAESSNGRKRSNREQQDDGTKSHGSSDCVGRVELALIRPHLAVSHISTQWSASVDCL